MDAKMFFEHLPAFIQRLQPLTDRSAAAIVPAEIGPGLFALENRGATDRIRGRPKCGHVCAESGLRQRHFHRARGITICLRPEQSKALQSLMRGSFSSRRIYSFVHSASSRAQ
jgi:hypothetical protein